MKGLGGYTTATVTGVLYVAAVAAVYCQSTVNSTPTYRASSYETCKAGQEECGCMVCLDHVNKPELDKTGTPEMFQYLPVL